MNLKKLNRCQKRNTEFLNKKHLNIKKTKQFEYKTQDEFQLNLIYKLIEDLSQLLIT